MKHDSGIPVGHVAKLLKVRRQRVHQMISEGKLDAFAYESWPGGYKLWFVKRPSLEAFRRRWKKRADRENNA